MAEILLEKRLFPPKYPLTVKVVFISFFAALVLIGCTHTSTSSSQSNKNKQLEPKLENLLIAKLARVEKTEVIVSRVTIPPNTSLPTHWHPGEEFGYVIQGSVTLIQKGKANITGKVGDVMKMPFKQIHSAKTQNEGAVILVFRIHESGQPERIIVN